MKPFSSIDDLGYNITYIFQSEHPLTRDEMMAAVAQQRETKSAQLLAEYLCRTKEELTSEQKESKAEQLLEEDLQRGGTVMISPSGVEADVDVSAAN